MYNMVYKFSKCSDLKSYFVMMDVGTGNMDQWLLHYYPRHSG